MSRVLLALALLGASPVPQALAAAPAAPSGAPSAPSEDEAFGVDARGGVILPLEDLVRRPGVDPGDVAAYQDALRLLQERRWEEAADAFAALARRLPAAEVHYGAAVAAFEMERYDRAARHLEAALTGHPEDVRATNMMGLILSAKGHGREAIAWFERCLAAARREGNAAFEAYALLNAAIAALEAGDAEGARERAERALRLGEAGGYGNVRAAAWNTLGNVALHLGDRARAEELYLASLKLERKGRGSGDRAVVLSNLAHLKAAAGRGAEALEWFAQALEEARARGDRAIQASVLVGSAAVAADLGQAEEAARRLSEAARIYGELGLRRGVAEVRLEQARQALGRGDATRALAHLDEAEAVLAELDLPVERADARILRASARALLGDPAGAEEDARAAERGYAAAGQAEGVARAQGLLGDLRRQADDPEGAEALYRRALDAYVRSGMATGEADLRGRLAVVLISLGRPEEAAREAQRARESLAGSGRLAALSALEDEIGVALDRVGRLEEALARYEAAIGAAEQAGREDLARHSRRNRASALLRLGRVDEAARAARESGDPELIAQVAVARATLAWQRGVAEIDARRPGPAEEAFRQALDLAPPGPAGDEVRGGARAGLAMVHRLRAHEAKGRGDAAAAADLFARAVEEARAGGQERVLVTALWDLAAFQAEAGDREGARPLLLEAVEVARRLGDPALLARLTLLLGNVRVDEDPEGARADYEAAAALAARLPDGAAIEAKARYNLGVLRARTGDREGAIGELRRARALFQARGEAAHVEEVDRLVRSLEEAGAAAGTAGEEEP